MRHVLRDFSPALIINGLVVVLVSYSGPLIIVFQAAKAGALSDAQIANWVWAISFGSAICGILLSLRFKLPIIAAWSTPGAAILASGLSVYSFEEAIGAFLLFGLLITFLGFSTFFQNLLSKIPKEIASAMLAGILLQFGLSLIFSAQEMPIVVLPMILIYLLGRRFFATFSLMAALTYGLIASSALGGFSTQHIALEVITPQITAPSFSLDAIISLGLPLFLVSVTTQNVPGVAVLEAAGYKNIPIKSILKTTGFISIVFAPFGGHGINLAAITAAICTGPDTHPDPSKRYIAGVFCGVFYMMFGLFSVTAASLIAALPAEFIAALAGLALLPALSQSLSVSMSATTYRDPALLTFLVTASGIAVFGMGAVFLGLLAGLAGLYLLTGTLISPKDLNQ